MRLGHPIKNVQMNMIVGLIFGKEKPIRQLHIAETVVSLPEIYAAGMSKKLNSTVMVDGIEFQDFILYLSVQNVITPKTTKFFMLMKGNW